MQPITRINVADLKPDSLGSSFRAGAAAVIIEGDSTVPEIWDALTASPALLPWASTLHDLSANILSHEDLTEVLGDVFYFKPERHLYIARKMEITQGEDQKLAVRPESFQNQGGNWLMSPDLQERCRSLVLRIMRAIGPAGSIAEDAVLACRAVVQQLKYHDTVAGHEALIRMMQNSLGGWARLGFRIDRQREQMCGPFGRRGVSDAIALLSLLPFLARPLNWLNQMARRFDTIGAVPDGYRLLSKAHVDTRYFSGLCGQRHNLRTEIYADRRWIPLPINCRDIAVIPGSRAMALYGIAPTIHRVLQAHAGPEDDVGDARLYNVTLLLGAK